MGIAEKCTATSTQAEGGESEAGRLGRNPKAAQELGLDLQVMGFQVGERKVTVLWGLSPCGGVTEGRVGEQRMPVKA